MAIQYPPLSQNIGPLKSNDTSAKLMQMLKILGQLPTPMGMASEEEDVLADLLAQGGEEGGITMKDLLNQGGKLVEKAPQAAEAPQTTAEMIKAFLAKKATNPPAAEAVQPEAPKIAESVRDLIAKSPKKVPIRKPIAEEATTKLERATGLNAVSPQANQASSVANEITQLRQLYDTAAKLKAPGPQKKIEDLISELTTRGVPKQNLGPLYHDVNMRDIVLKRKMIQDQLENLLRALGQKGK